MLQAEILQAITEHGRRYYTLALDYDNNPIPSGFVEITDRNIPGANSRITSQVFDEGLVRYCPDKLTRSTAAASGDDYTIEITYGGETLAFALPAAPPPAKRLDISTSLGFWVRGSHYLRAATVVVDDKLVIVRYFLTCHAIELLLKAFLRAHGVGPTSLKNYGHRIADCLESAKRLGLYEVAQLSEDDESSLRHISPDYEGKELEYPIRGGLKSFPWVGTLLRIASTLEGRLKDICFAKRKVPPSQD